MTSPIVILPFRVSIAISFLFVSSHEHVNSGSHYEELGRNVPGVEGVHAP